MKRNIVLESIKAPGDSVVRIQIIKSHILDNVVMITFIIALLSVLVSTVHGIHSYFRFEYFLHILVVAAIAVVAYLRKKIPYDIKILLMVVLFGSGAIAGFSKPHLTVQGVVFLVCAITLSSAFSRKVWTYLVMGMCLMILLGFAVYNLQLAANQNNISVEQYRRMVSTWIVIILSVMLFTSILIEVGTKLFYSLNMMLAELDSKVKAVEDLNNTLEEKVRIRSSELSKSNQEKDIILGVVAHDIKNKLTALVGFLDLMDDSSREVSKDKKENYLNKAVELSCLAAVSAQEVLDFAKLSGEASDNLTENLDMASLIKEVSENYRLKGMEKNIRFEVIVPEQPVYCRLNKSKIMSAMDNLILNAIKFSFNNSVITIRLTNDDRYAVLCVSDTGIGIPESIKQVIFEPFTIAGRSGTCNEKSTGLGLSIVKKIVDMHNGVIRVESTEGKGSQFFLQFPLS